MLPIQNMETLIDILGHFHYWGLFGMLILCGMGLPLPEDLVIATGGYFVYLGYTELVPTILVLYVGAMLGDFCLYAIGRRFGPDIIAHRRLTWLFTPRRIHAINHYFHRFGNLTLFFARFLVGLRSTIFLSAGAFKIPFKKMVLFDGGAALLSIPLITYLAYRFGGELDEVIVWMRRVEHSLWIVAALIVIIIAWKVRGHFKKEKLAEQEKIEELEIPKEE